MALTVGDLIPSITLPVQQGVSALPNGETLDITTAYPGKWKILFYWPKDFTFVCPTEIVGYGDLKGDFEDRDAILIGASTDSDFVHFAWRKSDERLAAADFPWLADNSKLMAEALGIIVADAGVALRATFIIDPDNIIQHVTINGLNVGRNPAETLRILEALQTDELCPCNWSEGEDVLRPCRLKRHASPSAGGWASHTHRNEFFPNEPSLPETGGGLGIPMIFTELAKTLPDYAKDQRLNVSSLVAEQLLTDQQKWGTFVAVAHACAYKPVIDAIEEEAAAKLSPEAMTAAKSAASIMAMNNIYYRFVHLASRAEYKTMPAKLRMNVIGSPGIDKADFELFSLAVSAINGCGMCIDAHDKVLAGHGVAPEKIQAAVRIASVVHAVARTLQAI